MIGKGWLIIFGGMLLAGMIAAFSFLLAYREEESISTRDKEPGNTLARAIQDELSRLDLRYESYVREALSAYQQRSDIQARQMASEVIGLTRLTLAVKGGMPGEEETLVIEPGASTPTFRQDSPLGLLDGQVLLDASMVSPERDLSSGWIYANNKERFRWLRQRGYSAKIATIDLLAVRDSINDWLVSGVIPFDVLPAGSDRLVDPSGETVWSNSEINWQSINPHRTIPISAQFGVWRLESFDPVEKSVVREPVILYPGLLLSLFVALLSTAIGIAYSRAVHLSSQRVSFVNQASHELRTPITNILLNSELASESIEDEPFEAETRLGLISEEAERLSRLVDNILTFSRGEQQELKVVKSAVIPDELIRQVVRTYQSSFDRLGIKIESTLSAEREIQTDPDAFSQIIVNLISNVEKYARSGKWLSIKSQMDGDQLIVDVQDKGPGISRSAQAKVFDPFYRPRNQTTEGVTGTGLGLAISRDLAEKLNGTLELLSAEEGCHFRLTICES